MLSVLQPGLDFWCWPLIGYANLTALFHSRVDLNFFPCRVCAEMAIIRFFFFFFVTLEYIEFSHSLYTSQSLECNEIGKAGK